MYAFGRSDVVGLPLPEPSSVFGACDSAGSRRLGRAWRLSALAFALCSVVRGCVDMEWWVHGDEGFRSFLGSAIRQVHGGLGAFVAALAPALNSLIPTSAAVRPLFCWFLPLVLFTDRPPSLILVLGFFGFA